MKWDSESEVLDLCRDLAFGNCRAKDPAYRDIGSFDPKAFARVARVSVTQRVAEGQETRWIESILAASLLGAVRDFTESEGGVDSALNGVPVAAWIGAAHAPLRKAMRRQLRRSLDSPVWTITKDGGAHEPRAGFIGVEGRVYWRCPYCGESVAANDGFGRRTHLDVHPGALPARHDVGCAISRSFTRRLMLLLMASLVRGRSWPNHRRYYVETGAIGQLDRHFGCTDARVGFKRAAELLEWPLGSFPHCEEWM